MRKVLIINTIGMGFEGMSSVIVNYVSAMDRNGLEIDFVASPTIREDFKKILDALGNVRIIPKKKKDLMGYMRGLAALIKERKYDVVHIHGNSATMAIEAAAARLGGVKKVIVHTHNTRCDHPVINVLLTPVMKFFATDFLACSSDAGRWLYRNDKFLVLNNAINTKKYSFDKGWREEKRREFGIGNELVIGHIGSFLEQKNHVFLAEVFKEYHKIDSEAKLLLLSSGQTMEEIKKKVTDAGLDKFVIFAGRRNDAEKFYSAMDVFVLPSLWEGLPLVLLEAQASGLRCIVSDRVTKDAAKTDLVSFLPLDEGFGAWAENISDIKLPSDRKKASEDAADEIRKSGFDITRQAEVLKKIYSSP